MTIYDFFATAPKHMEALVADELRGLGVQDVRETRGGASFTGTLETACRACLWSRVANRILLVLGRFPAATPEALYAGTRTIPWHEHFDASATFAVQFISSHSAITHSHFGALKVKDAIVDQFREQLGERPSVETEQPDIRINVYVMRDQATVSLDLSGESLHRRGYREPGVAAPLKENLAAAILLRAGWPGIAAAGGALVDPMCGSGTLPIEAALIAADIAPGLRREHWGFTGWKQHDAATWQRLLDEADDRRAKGLAQLPPVRGYDHHATAVRYALANVERAGLHGHVHIEKRELEQAAPGHPGDTGLVVANPPYGERLGSDSDLPALYARLGNALKNQFGGWRAAVFTGNPELGKHIGLRARRRHTLFNGPIECKLLHFEVSEEWYLVPSRLPRPLPAHERSDGALGFANRLQKNLKHLGRWARREDVQCYRLYDADLPEYALAVDLYHGDKLWVHVQEYEAPRSVDPKKARLRVREALGVIIDVLEVTQDELYFKVRRQQKGSAQYQKLASSEHVHEVTEGGNRFLVNFEDYLDTGLFLDHRPTRAMIAELAGGRRFLNLFAYTGTATVYAARGGATATTTVDMSNTYLDWARRNMVLNGFTGKEHTFVRADCLEWLRTADAKSRYGLIFLDPPSFSTSKRMKETFDVQRDHAALIRQTARLLEPDGVFIFSTNLRGFRMDREALPEFEIENISRATLPPDFERNPKIHSCWKLRHR